MVYSEPAKNEYPFDPAAQRREKLKASGPLACARKSEEVPEEVVQYPGNLNTTLREHTSSVLKTSRGAGTASGTKHAPRPES